MATAHEIDHDEIARRAHELAEAGDGSQTDEENWFQAERELRAGVAGNSDTTRTAGEAVPEAD